MFHQCVHSGFCDAQRKNMAEYILIVNKVANTRHILVPFIPVPTMHIYSALCSVSQVCALGTRWVHLNCVQAVPENVMRGYRLVTFKI